MTGSTFSDNIASLKDERARRRGGGGGGGSDDLERRIAVLEDGYKLIISKLDGIATGITDLRLETEKRFGAIESQLVGVDVKLDKTAAKSDLTPLESKISDVSGAIRMIPNVWQTLAVMAGLLVGVTGLAFTIAKWAHP